MGFCRIEPWEENMAEAFASNKIKHIRKRDESIVPFDGSKIYSAILKAGQATTAPRA